MIAPGCEYSRLPARVAQNAGRRDFFAAETGGIQGARHDFRRGNDAERIELVGGETALCRQIFAGSAAFVFVQRLVREPAKGFEQSGAAFFGFDALHLLWRVLALRQIQADALRE